MSDPKYNRHVKIDAAELGPRKVREGEVFTASWDRYAEEYVRRGGRWVLARTWRASGGLGGEWSPA